jgi:glycosyltransferase involved in cell wall biosynthesis
VAEFTDNQVRLLPLPPYGSMAESFLRSPAVCRQFYRHLVEIRQATVLLIRVPSLMGLILAELGRALGKKICFFVCADLETTAIPIITKGGRLGVWRKLTRGLTRLTQLSARRALVLVAGEELARIYQKKLKFIPAPAAVFNFPDHMYSEKSLFARQDTCQGKQIRLLRVCQLYPVKGMEILLKAVRILVDQGWPVELEVLGGGTPDYLASLQRLAEELGLASRVSFLGSLPFEEVMTRYRQADIQIISSLAESLPRVIMEGWSASLPLVSTAVGGIPGLVHHEQNGLLAPPGDAQALADAVGRVIADHGLRQRLIQKAFALARAASREKQAARMSVLIKKFATGQSIPGDPDKESVT